MNHVELSLIDTYNAIARRGELFGFDNKCVLSLIDLAQFMAIAHTTPNRDEYMATVDKYIASVAHAFNTFDATIPGDDVSTVFWHGTGPFMKTLRKDDVSRYQATVGVRDYILEELGDMEKHLKV